MSNCIRLGKFGKKEKHICFKCGKRFKPLNKETCKICNWKRCPEKHCGCTVSKETKEMLDKFYDLFCKNQNYSNETKKALLGIVKVYYKHCKRCLE